MIAPTNDDPGWPEPGFPEDYLTALGRLTVVSSTVDHTLSLLLYMCEGKRLGDYDLRSPAGGRRDTMRALRRATRRRVNSGDMTVEMATFALEWAQTAIDLLGERDKAVHAMWGYSPDDWSIRGFHRSGPPPGDADELMDIVDRSRAHVREWTVERQLQFRRLAAS